MMNATLTLYAVVLLQLAIYTIVDYREYIVNLDGKFPTQFVRKVFDVIAVEQCLDILVGFTTDLVDFC